MSKMQKPEVEAVRFGGGGTDVIATSGGIMTLSKFGGTDGDAEVNFNGTTYYKNQFDKLLADVNAKYSYNGQEIYLEGKGFLGDSMHIEKNFGNLNGTYMWFGNGEVYHPGPGTNLPMVIFEEK